MFTGLVEEMGRVEIVRRGRIVELFISASKVVEDLRVGDSIAVNGACLTATRVEPNGFWAELSPETISRTTLGQLRPGDPVNLERPLRLGDRLGGHLVLGHVDEVGVILGMREMGGSKVMSVRVSPQGMRYIVEKGSVCVDGVSLTVAAVGESSFEVALIPHTLAVTTLGLRKPGDEVNVEFDIIGKYVERLLGRGRGEEGITVEFLREHGFA
ncbi:riboflavin synthase [Candidatus Poribacteria bacterium]|nr:MAG: riboflavin synthase [Candidatus Poribacteria bacterium]